MTTSSLQRKLLKLLLLLAVLYAVLCAALFYCQRSLLYFPQDRQRTDMPTLELAADGARILVTLIAALTLALVISCNASKSAYSLSGV